MPTIRCVEPANAVPGGDQFLVQVAPANELLFPHVDSCLAITFILSDGRLIGGHVGMMMPGAGNLDPRGNANALCNQMLALVPPANITRLVMVGDANWEQDLNDGTDIIQELINTTHAPISYFVDTGAYGGGVDVSFNPRRSMMFIQLCTGGRALVHQRPYAEMVGHSIRRLP